MGGGKDRRRQPVLHDRVKVRVVGYAEAGYSYFEKYVTEKQHYLPPDNYEEAPVKALACRTSPTNIGLYLLSVMAMHDLGKLDTDAMLERLSRTLSTLEALPKYRGHLYNWYDTTTLEVLGRPFVSTVDSGNFALCLTAVMQRCG